MKSQKQQLCLEIISRYIDRDGQNSVISHLPLPIVRAHVDLHFIFGRTREGTLQDKKGKGAVIIGLAKAEKISVAADDFKVIILTSASGGKLDPEQAGRNVQSARDIDVMMRHTQRKPAAMAISARAKRQATASFSSAYVSGNLPVAEFISGH